jgi:hypothetical protein
VEDHGAAWLCGSATRISQCGYVAPPRSLRRRDSSAMIAFPELALLSFRGCGLNTFPVPLVAPPGVAPLTPLAARARIAADKSLRGQPGASVGAGSPLPSTAALPPANRGRSDACRPAPLAPSPSAASGRVATASLPPAGLSVAVAAPTPLPDGPLTVGGSENARRIPRAGRA